MAAGTSLGLTFAAATEYPICPIRPEPIAIRISKPYIEVTADVVVMVYMRLPPTSMKIPPGMYHGMYLPNTGSNAPENMVKPILTAMNGSSRTAAWMAESPFVNWKNRGM